MLLQEEFDECVRRALGWIAQQEERALSAGLALSHREQDIARQANVREVARVRLVPVASMPAPDDPFLQSAMQATGFWLHGAAGLTLGHAIFIVRAAGTERGLGTSTCSDGWRDESLIAHELVHVAQAERLGLEEFLRLYLQQCLSVGYSLAPLEREARDFRFNSPAP